MNTGTCELALEDPRIAFTKMTLHGKGLSKQTYMAASLIANIFAIRGMIIVDTTKRLRATIFCLSLLTDVMRAGVDVDM